MRTITQSTLQQQTAIAATLLFFMLLTRGSHVLTSVALPDASLVIFLLGGIYLKHIAWFALFFMAGATIDFGAAAWNPYYGFCLTEGYWGLIPTYAVMWLGGRWLEKKADTFSLKHYLPVTLICTLLAFIISTQTYYLFSGRFPNAGVHETILHGWNYMPSYLAYTMMYCMIIWSISRLFRQIRALRHINV